jgi:hypothetical protein
MFSSTVRRAAETVGGGAALVDPAELVTLAELASEGFGYGGQYVQSPRDAIRVLADQLAGDVVVDNLGRQCVTRDRACTVFAERAGRAQAAGGARPQRSPA